jgi:glutamate-1-semialdehyde 2,1-aminomutase
MGQRRDELLTRAIAVPEMLARAKVQPVPLKAQGVRVYDVDNVGYIDYLGGGGAAIVGYANQYVIDAVRKVLVNGIPDGLHVPQEVELAESLQQMVPWSGSWWFSRTSDEALRGLLLWARRETGKDLFLVLDGGASISAGKRLSGDRETGFSREVPGWDLERIEAALTAGGSKVAALVLDPLMTRVGLVPPPAGALPLIAEMCHRAGVLFVLDERVSGFRLHRAGAAARFGVTPDLALYGGALGGGFSIGAVAFGKGFSPPPDLGNEGGLPAPHPMSLAAAEAVLSILRNDTTYERLEGRTEQLVNGIVALGERFGRPMVVNRMGSAFAFYMSRQPVVDRMSAERADEAAYRRFVGALRVDGVLMPQDPCGTAFVSNAHGAKDVDETLAVCERVLMRLHQEDLP